MTAGTVEKHQRRLAGVAGVQVAGAHSPRVEVTLRERDALEIAPDALELRHSSPSLDGENLILVFCKHSAHLSHIHVHYSQSITLGSASVKEGAPWLHRSARQPPTPHRTVRPARRPWPGVWRRCNWSPTSRTGLTVQQVADDIGVHRTIAYRLLSTLAQFRMVAKGEDSRYRSAAALAVLGASFDNNVRQLSVPTLRGLADELGTTVSLLVAEGDQQVAIAVIVPTNVFYQLSFHEGSRYPLERGAAGIALLASMPPRPGERDLVPQARQQGWIITHGEVEPNTYGLAVPVRRRPPSPPTCINLISHREDVVMGGRDAVIKAADELSAILS